jgi:putative membrane protein
MNLNWIAYTFRATSATALLAGAVALAQTPGVPVQPVQQPMPQYPTNPNSGMPGSPVSNPNAYPGNASKGPDYAANEFVSKAMEGNLAEVQLGQLAQQKSQSNDVKQFAQKMVSEHGQMNDKWFMPVAQQLGISVPKEPSKKDKKEMEKLQGLSGQDFDRQYIAMMVKNHQRDLKKFKGEANVAQNPNVRQVATEGAKVISQQLEIAEELAKNHNVQVKSDGKEVSSTK